MIQRYEFFRFLYSVVISFDRSYSNIVFIVKFHLFILWSAVVLFIHFFFKDGVYCTIEVFANKYFA